MWDSRFRVQDLGFRVWDFGFRVYGLGLMDLAKPLTLNLKFELGSCRVKWVVVHMRVTRKP